MSHLVEALFSLPTSHHTEAKVSFLSQVSSRWFLSHPTGLSCLRQMLLRGGEGGGGEWGLSHTSDHNNAKVSRAAFHGNRPHLVLQPLQSAEEATVESRAPKSAPPTQPPHPQPAPPQPLLQTVGVSWTIPHKMFGSEKVQQPMIKGAAG